ncbi:60S ribosomal protein L13 [Perkinsus olseni]|uniref:60S ribosomal protein L13 n=1 Tax=Perkinsus olseni TaxID=32597 RepID=A0A7J6L5F3_PEROL|nr:60S ribosomal protein L13 [Perkinsus olseni]KAF4654421.1 60S ribosomal protein L13 [Perkinsus olseni]
MAVKYNNVIPNIHFRKYWQKHIKTWFDQPARKHRRRLTRQSKAAATYPRPSAGLLRPVVRPPTQRYNYKLRLGRGFTVEELAAAGISVKLAPTIGIKVDKRRHNKSEESLALNVDRLNQYKAKLAVFPRGSKAKNGDTARAELANATQNTCKTIIPVPTARVVEHARAITKEERETSAYTTLRQARITKKMAPKRAKAAEEKAKAEK